LRQMSEHAMCSFCSRLSAIVIVVVCGLAPRLAFGAADEIGLAAVVRNHVDEVEPAYSRIKTGDNINRDEVVETFADSSAKFVLKDSTNLMLGPNSKLKLDRAVFSDEKGIGDFAIKLSLGAFRMVTGNSAKESYVINTPLATLGVRGTILDFRNERYKNTIVLKQGQSSVCVVGHCVELVNVVDTAVVTSVGSRINIDVQPSSNWSFDSACNGMCSPTTFAEAKSAVNEVTGSLGGAGGGGGRYPAGSVPSRDHHIRQCDAA